MTIARIQSINVSDQFIEITESDDQVAQIARETLSAQDLIGTYGVSELKFLFVERPSPTTELFLLPPIMMLFFGSLQAISESHPLLITAYCVSLFGFLFFALAIAPPYVQKDCETAAHNMHLLAQALPNQGELKEHENRLNKVLGLKSPYERVTS